MTTEEALEHIKASKQASEANTPSVEVSKSEESTANSPEDKAANDDNKVAEPTEVKKDVESDESKSSNNEVEKKEDKAETKPIESAEPKSKFPEMSKRDYAFIREKDKRKQQKAKYEARIKELEAELERKKGLDYEYFKNQDGTPDPKSYVNWKFKERDMQDEIRNLRYQDEQEQLNYDRERDRVITERCFTDPNELREYNELIATKGQAFAEAVSERDPNGVVFKYLETLNDYPIVLKELMDLQKNPNLLPRVFRSSDPDTLKHNIALVADEILTRRYSNPNPVSQVAPVQPETNNKPALPVIGKQITNNTTTVEPQVRDRNWWNNYLKNHPRGR
jgi:hypothetical protein